MALISVSPPPGVVTSGTEYSAKGRWVDSNLIRFQDGILKNIGGWEYLKSSALTGAPIGLFAWKDNDGNNLLAVGTREKVYVYMDESLTWYDITPTSFVTPKSTDPLGYGSFTYNVEDYGDARSQSGLSFAKHSYSFDNWGEYLIFCCSSDGKIYQWRPDAGSGSPDAAGVALTNAPTGCSGVLVSNERHIIALGAGGDPRKVQWSSREASTTWTAASTNTAGDLQVPTSSELLAGVKWQTDMILFTSTGLARLYYSGQPFVYGINDAGTNCKAISARSIVQAGNFIAWLGEKTIFLYDGSVREIPCSVSDFIFDNINKQYSGAVCGGHNSSFNEIWWFFPSGDSKVPNKYIIWNYASNNFAIGTLNRGCYLDEGIFDYVIACDDSGNVYKMESGNLFNSPGLGSTKPYATSGAIQIGNGDNYVQCNQIIPDSEASTLPGVTISFKGKYTPLGETFDFGSFTFESDGYTDARFNGRQVMMTVTGDTNQDFKLGDIRLDVTNRGRR